MIMPKIVIGGQWGDEGKGKIVDFLAKDADIVVRFNGGNNAGHTVIYNGQQCKLHILPSGIFQQKKLIMASGMVFDPEVLLTELEFCRENKIKLDLLIDYRVNLVMPYHKLMDGAHEAWKGKKATGSVRVGIGYCYEDRNNRSGIRCEDLLYPKILKEKIFTLFPLKKAFLEKVYGLKVELKPEEIYKRMLFLAKILKPFLGDASKYLSENIHKKRVLFEGAMGTMLDGQFGTYPFTVANNTIASSVFPAIGLPFFPVDVIGILKAYTTRVGGGPFPTEQKNKDGEILQTIGKEIAATSGRTRRCGWLDLNVLRFAHRLNNFSSIIVTKLDVLSQFKEIPVCVAYKVGDKKILEYPPVTHDFYQCQPVYKIFKGWQQDISKIRRYQDLPVEAKNYLDFIKKGVGVPIKYISVGPEREAIIKDEN